MGGDWVYAYGVLGLISLIMAFFSGLLGIGGFLLIPGLLYLPPLFGVASLDARTVAGVTMIQTLFAAISGIMLHRRRGFVMVPLILWVGVTALIGSMTGALTSKVVSNKLIETVFAAGAVLGGLLMSMPIRHEGRFAPERPIGFHHGRAIGIGLGCGVFAGMTGVGGSFLLIPLMRSTLEIPLRVVVGSNLGIVLLTALSGSIGKVVTGQVRLSLAVTVVLGAIPGALLGSRVSTIVSERILRSLLMVLIFLTAILMWGGVFLKNT